MCDSIAKGSIDKNKGFLGFESIRAERVALLRQETGLSLAEMAMKCDSDRVARIAREWEDADGWISSFMIYRICQEFGVSSDWLLGLSDERQKPNIW